MNKLGTVIKIYPKIKIALVSLSADVFLGQKVYFTDQNGQIVFNYTIENIKQNHQNLDFAKAGSVIGLKINEEVKVGYEIYRS